MEGDQDKMKDIAIDGDERKCGNILIKEDLGINHRSHKE